MMHRRKTHPLTQWFLLGSSLVVLGAGLLVQAPRAAAGDSQDALAGRCTIQNVAGSYGFLGTGTNLPNPVGFPETLIATVGILTFDGQGNWVTTNHSLTFNGQVTTVVSLSGTYTVNPDCTYTLDDRGNLLPGVFVHDRQEGFLMEAVEGVVVTFTLKRIGN